MSNFVNIKGSFRDPSGFVFSSEGIIYRQINDIYKDHYEHLMNSGLYEKLVHENLLIPHVEVDEPIGNIDNIYKIIKPEMIDFISYPYEWCFSQFKDAALATIRIQKIALEYGMSLKDSSSYNIQFRDGKPVFIDTLSFEIYKEGKPWVAYRQFCQHFLAPLALMSYKDIRLNQLLRIYIDGVPLDLASSLLPLKTKFKSSILLNIHLHAKSQQKYSNSTKKVITREMSKTYFTAIINSLEIAVKKLKWEPSGTEWGDYYSFTNYSDESFQNKHQLVEKFINKTNSDMVWDMGSNTGVFSRIPAKKDVRTVSFDIDPVAVEKNYLQCIKDNERNVLPLLLDLTNPSPGIGWNAEERMSFKDRKLPGTVMALALIHHLAISNNVPMNDIASFFAGLCEYLIIEFIPKSDSQVQKLLATREDIFNNYNEESFIESFEKYFSIEAEEKIMKSDRVLFLMKGRK